MSLSKNILVVVTSHSSIDSTHPTGLWFEEFAMPYLAFRAQGMQITIASPRGGVVPIDPRSELEIEQDESLKAARTALQRTQPLGQMTATNFDAVFLPGGHGTMFDLPGNTTLQCLLADFAQADKVISAVCHGLAGFVGVQLASGKPLVAGRTITAFTNEEERATGLDPLMPFLLETRLRELGGRFVEGPNWADHVERDGKLITGQNPQSSGSVAQAIIDVLTA